jgi:hypothetical protein
MEIVGKALTTCQVDPSGDSFRLGFESVDGHPASVVLPTDCLRSLLMTLPNVIELALKARYRDDTLKVVYPIGGYSLEAAAGSTSSILTLTTPDGFKVSFALTPEDAGGLATSLVEIDVAQPRATFN